MGEKSKAYMISPAIAGILAAWLFSPMEVDAELVGAESEILYA